MANYQLTQTGAEVQALLDAVQSPEATKPEAGSSKLITSGAVAGAIANNLTTNDATKILSAKQGKVLKDAQDTQGAELTELEQKVDEKVDGVYVENPEYIRAYTDSNDRFLWGIKPDGSIEWAKGIPQPVRDFVATSIIAGKQFTDAQVTELVELIGTIYEISDVEGRIELRLDTDERIVAYRKGDGTWVENVGIEAKLISANTLHLSSQGINDLAQALRDAGVDGGTGDWSDKTSLEISEPRLALINLTRIDGQSLTWPTTKTADIPCNFQFWDLQGNYFKKYILLNAQGNSSLAFVKKNGAFDLFNEDPTDPDFDEDNTFSLKIGNWVAMDSYHLKAFYTEFTRGAAIVAYKVAELVEKQRGLMVDKPWKKALLGKYTWTDSQATSAQLNDMSLQMDNGALCHPDAFPCIVFLDGEFYGIYAFAIKKDRKNYVLNKKKPNNIHLDGDLTVDNIFSPSNGIQWTQFEIRNPKKLVYATAHDGTYKYDADAPGQYEIAGNSDGSQTYPAWSAGSYAVDVIVTHNGHQFLNTIANNTAEPIITTYNKDDDPDFKNKTGCGWLNVTNTIKVKEAIIALSTRVPAIVALGTDDAKRAYLETYFDVDNLIDYELSQIFTGDTDGTGKNWQWITYDGVKWYCTEYDKDMAFGNIFNGMYTRTAAQVPGWIGNEAGQPLGQVIRLYESTIKSYGLSLLAGPVTSDAIIDFFKDWMDRVGQQNYEKEWQKWPESPCNRDPLIDTDHWERTDVVTMVAPAASEMYDAGKTYDPDSATPTDTYCYSGASGYYFKFNAKVVTTGNPPLTGTSQDTPTIMGYRDSFWRIVKYVEARISMITNFLQN